MVSAQIPTVACVVCGSSEWAACRPGTATDQGMYDGFRCEELIAWCDAHEPLRRAAKPKHNQRPPPNG